MSDCDLYTTVQKFYFCFFKELLLLFSEDALNWSKITVQTHC